MATSELLTTRPNALRALIEALHTLGDQGEPSLTLGPAGRVPVDALLEAAARLESIPSEEAAALAAARAVPKGAAGIVELLAQACPDVRTGLAMFARYSVLLSPAMKCTLEREGDGAAFVYATTPEVARPAIFAELVLALLFDRTAHAAGPAFRVKRVEFAHQAPKDITPYEQYFQAPVTFGANRDALVIDGLTLDLPLRTSEPDVLIALRARADELLVEDDDVLLGGVRRTIGQLLPAGVPSLREVARAQGLSVRTLQRRLQERQLSFRALVDEVRKRAATASLRRQSATTAEIAEMVGFADVAGFTRAFRRWTGSTPARFRRASERPPSS